MKKRINQIAEIKSGFLFKTGIRPDRDGNVSIIQLKDVDNRGNLNFAGIQKVAIENYNASDCVKPGDILFKAKTNHPVSALVSRDLGKAIATAHYFILRLNTVDVLPGYLAWYFNQRPAQIYFSTYAGGTRIQVITKQVLGNLEVVIPDLVVQKKIEKVYGLRCREGKLLEALKEKKEKLVSAQLMGAISEQS